MKELTPKQKKGLKVLLQVNKKVCSNELIDNYSNILKENDFPIDRASSINATLSSLYNDKYVDKDTTMTYNNKFYTHYSITQKGITYLKENN